MKAGSEGFAGILAFCDVLFPGRLPIGERTGSRCPFDKAGEGLRIAKTALGGDFQNGKIGSGEQGHRLLQTEIENVAAGRKTDFLPENPRQRCGGDGISRISAALSRV